MVQISQIKKIDHAGRVSVPPKILELMQIDKGFDRVYWAVEDGKIILRKVTRSYYGYDPEAEDIESNILMFESGILDSDSESVKGMSPEELRKLAFDRYVVDRERRSKLRAEQDAKRSYHRTIRIEPARDNYQKAKVVLKKAMSCEDS